MKLSKLKSYLTIFAFMSGIAPAGMASQELENRHLLQGASGLVDVTPLLSFVQTHTYHLTSPKIIFHWAFRPDLRSVSLSTDPVGFQYAKQGAAFYWQGQVDQPNSSDFYGRGLYFSKDPVSSEGYGENPEGNGDSWLLLQLTIPTTARIFDLNGFEVSKTSPSPADIQMKQILTALGCSDDVTDGRSGSWAKNLMRPKHSSSPTCIAAIHEIFSQLNPIDLFVYDYRAFSFSACAAPVRTLGEEAFVVTDGSWLRPEFVRIFDPSTKDNSESRQIIQGIFDRANNEKLENPIAHQYDGLPTRHQLWADIPQNSVETKQTDEFLRQFNFRCVSEGLYQAK